MSPHLDLTELFPVADEFADMPPIKSLPRGERRVLGTLIEKGLTTPDQYPLTLKSCTSGSNQKNNRDPVTNYDEDQVQDLLDRLREKGLVGEMHSDGARVPKYRHYVRKRLTISEAQLAVLCELLLRGRQQPGDLRTRAGRMVEIPSQDQLRVELQGLVELGLVVANGPLDRRGVEVDHTWYEPGERTAGWTALAPEPARSPAVPPAVATAAASSPAPSTPHAAAPVATSPAAAGTAQVGTLLEDLRRELAHLRTSHRELSDQVATLANTLAIAQSEIASLKASLGG
jgi:uncharacterized protein YceH (UPF0502 family)